MKLGCAGITKITQVIVTSCYIANNNSTFFKIYRQVKNLNYRLGILSERNFAPFGAVAGHGAGGISDVRHNIDGQAAAQQLLTAVVRQTIVGDNAIKAAGWAKRIGVHRAEF